APFDSISRAAAAIAGTNSLVYGRNDCAGARIFIRGTNSFIGAGGSPPSTMGNTWLTIAGYPGDDPATCQIVDGNGAGNINGMIKLENLRFNSPDTDTLSNCSNLWFAAGVILDSVGADTVTQSSGSGIVFAT